MVALQSVTNRSDITVDYENRKATEWFCVMGECYEYFETKNERKLSKTTIEAVQAACFLVNKQWMMPI